MNGPHDVTHRQSITVLGITLIILGVLAAALPLITSIAITLILGLSILISGIAYSVNAFYNKRWTGFLWCLFIGIISIIAGFLLLGHPLFGIYTITLLIAAFLIVQGIFKTIFSLSLKKERGRFWLLLNGIISIALGILIWYALPASPWILGFLVSIDLLLAGWSMTLLASRKKEMDW